MLNILINDEVQRTPEETAALETAVSCLTLQSFKAAWKGICNIVFVETEDLLYVTRDYDALALVGFRAGGTKNKVTRT